MMSSRRGNSLILIPHPGSTCHAGKAQYRHSKTRSQHKSEAYDQPLQAPNSGLSTRGRYARSKWLNLGSTNVTAF